MSETLASLVSSRICHDLISPIGSINNGIELLNLTGGPASEEIDLISESAMAASSRILFFRTAYGRALPHQTISAKEVRTVLDSLAKQSKHRFEWHSRSELSRREAKAALLAIQCLESCLIANGSIEIHEVDTSWTMVAFGESIDTNMSLWETVANPHSDRDFTSAEVQFVLLAQTLKTMNRKFIYHSASNKLTISF